MVLLGPACGEQVGRWALESVQGGTLGVSPSRPQLAPASWGGSEVTGRRECRDVTVCLGGPGGC